MKELEFTIDDFNQILEKSLREIVSNIKNHVGVMYTIKNKLSFEKWFQLELLKQLIERSSGFNIEIEEEFEVGTKVSKKGLTIDIVILKNKVKFIAIELKIIPTNYKNEYISPKTKRTPELINDFIKDLSKGKDEYEHSISLAFIWPFSINLESKDYFNFKKQENKFNSNVTVRKLEGNVSDKFNSYFYILYKRNLQ